MIEVAANTMLGMMNVELATDLISFAGLSRNDVVTPLAGARFYR